MRTGLQPAAQRGPLRIPLWVGFCLFLTIAVFFLWEEHRAHILGLVPYVLLLLCPIIHLLMHRGHGSHGGDRPQHGAHPRHGHGEGAAS